MNGEEIYLFSGNKFVLWQWNFVLKEIIFGLCWVLFLSLCRKLPFPCVLKSFGDNSFWKSWQYLIVKSNARYYDFYFAISLCWAEAEGVVALLSAAGNKSGSIHHLWFVTSVTLYMLQPELLLINREY